MSGGEFHYTHRAGHRRVENARGTAVRAGQAGALAFPTAGAVDPLARLPSRKRAICSQCPVLRAKGLGGSQSLSGDFMRDYKVF